MNVTVSAGATDAASGGAAARDASSAQARAVAYALFSQLVASPAEGLDPAHALPPADLGAALGEIAAGLPYDLDLRGLSDASDALEPGPDEAGPLARELAAVYSGLFEVGSNGPPVPLCEGHVEGRPESTREEIVRFYDFFGYGLRRERQWRPDHLSVELEFLHFLAFREAAGGSGAVGLRLGQLDFLERHPASWLPAAAELMTQRITGTDSIDRVRNYYRELLGALSRYLTLDAEWQRKTAGEES